MTEKLKETMMSLPKRILLKIPGIATLAKA